MSESVTDRIRVGLVDDQQLVRAGLAMVIDSQADMTVAWQAGDGAEAIRLAATPTDIILMDVRMPGMDGIAAAGRIVECCDRPRVIMLTTYDVDEYLLSAIRAGASGFLLKNAPPADLLAAVRTVHSGDAVIAPSSTRRLLEHVATGVGPVGSPEPDERLAGLTDREREILLLIARGLSNAEISAELYLSETTVKTHVRHVLAKLGVRDRVQAVVVAFETGLAHVGG
jgi:DNA-binding NarL/FixJ family response regulator